MKRVGKRELVKTIALRSSGVSRQDVARDADLDIRTAAAYLQDLATAGVLQCKSRPSRRGRPHDVYLPNTSNVLFVGMSLYRRRTGCSCRCVAIDAAGSEVGHGVFESDENDSSLSLINKTIELIRKVIGGPPRGRVITIGIAKSRWLDGYAPLAAAMPNLKRCVRAEFSAELFLNTPVNVLCYASGAPMRVDSRIATVHLGEIIELGLTLGGTVPDEQPAAEQSFAHTSVIPNGPKCFCGSRGCLENAATFPAVMQVWQQRRPTVASTRQQFLDELSAGHPDAVAVIDDVRQALIVALKEVCCRLRLNRLVLLCSRRDYSRTLYAPFRDAAYVQQTIGGGVNVEVLDWQSSKNHHVAARMARYLGYSRHIEMPAPCPGDKRLAS